MTPAAFDAERAEACSRLLAAAPGAGVAAAQAGALQAPEGWRWEPAAGRFVPETPFPNAYKVVPRGAY